MARKRLLKAKSLLWSGVLGALGLCVAGCPPIDPPIAEYGPAPMYGIPKVQLDISVNPSDLAEDSSIEQA
jgi:hypothetical protein